MNFFRYSRDKIFECNFRGKDIVMKTNSISKSSTTVNKNRNFKKNMYMYVLLIPAISFAIIFNYLPMAGLAIAFKDYDVLIGFGGSPWVGIEHFSKIFKFPGFVKAIKNTLIYSSVSLFGQFPFPIFLALCINEVRNMWAKKFVQTVSYLPYFLSWMSVIGFAYSIFAINGSFNDIMVAIFGEGYKRTNLLLNSNNFLSVIFLSGLWKTIGWSSIIYLAAICGVDQSYYEAAEIDGCSRLGKIWHITLPSIRTTAVLVLILGVGNLVTTNFEQVYGFQNVYIQNDTEVINTLTYREGIQNGNYSMATAFSLTQGIVSLILVIATNRISKKISGVSIW